MSMTPEIYEVCILETMIDSMGHLNNATYLQLFEQARWQWCHDKGVGYDYVVKNQIGFAILEVHLRFGKEVKAREHVRIETKIIAFKKKIATIEQVMLNEHGDVCCSALFTSGLFDLKKRKLVVPSDEWLERLGVRDFYETQIEARCEQSESI